MKVRNKIIGTVIGITALCGLVHVTKEQPINKEYVEFTDRSGYLLSPHEKITCTNKETKYNVLVRKYEDRIEVENIFDNSNIVDQGLDGNPDYAESFLMSEADIPVVTMRRTLREEEMDFYREAISKYNGEKI